MILRFYPEMLNIVDKLYDLNDKLNKFADENLGSVWAGTLLFGAILFVAIWGIRTLNKK